MRQRAWLLLVLLGTAPALVAGPDQDPFREANDLVRAGDYPRAIAVVERLLLLTPDDSGEIRDRGLLRAHLGHRGPAIADLERCLSLAPGAPDIRSVESRLAWLRRRATEAS